MVWDVIVLGLGGVGSAAIRHLAKRGAKVLGIDQHPPVHSFGSSHGRTRIVRQAYFEDPLYVPLLKRAYELWDDLSYEMSRDLFIRCGVLQVGPANGIVVPGVVDAAEEHDLRVQMMDRGDVQSRWPAIGCPEGASAVFEENAGFVHVESCVESQLASAVRAGATCLHESPVESWQLESDGVRVTMPDATFFTQHLVIAGGAWSRDLLSLEHTLPIRVLRKHLYWFDSDRSGLEVNAGFPCFFHETVEGCFYGFPILDELGVKVAMHTGGVEVNPPGSMQRSDYQAASDQCDGQLLEYENVAKYVTRLLPGVSTRLNRRDSCYYSMSPDSNFFVDHLGDGSPVTVIAGLSGHGFKFTPVLGEIAAMMALGETVPFDLSPFRLNRF